MGAEDQVDVVVEKKSSGFRWLWGVLGCLALVVLVCGGIGAWTWFGFLKPRYDFTSENRTLVEENDLVKETLGEPIRIGEIKSVEANFVMTITMPVVGSLGSGDVVVTGEMDQQNFTWTRTDAYLEYEGEKIEIDPDEGLSFEIEGID